MEREKERGRKRESLLRILSSTGAVDGERIHKRCVNSLSRPAVSVSSLHLLDESWAFQGRESRLLVSIDTVNVYIYMCVYIFPYFYFLLLPSSASSYFFPRYFHIYFPFPSYSPRRYFVSYFLGSLCAFLLSLSPGVLCVRPRFSIVVVVVSFQFFLSLSFPSSSNFSPCFSPFGKLHLKKKIGREKSEKEGNEK